jgi:hypothetical protein
MANQIAYQCGRCGSSIDFVECQNCGGEGYAGHDCGEDSCCCGDGEVDNVVCDICEGKGFFPLCVSSKEWCEAHPLPDHENVPRHTVECYSTVARRRTR